MPICGHRDQYGNRCSLGAGHDEYDAPLEHRYDRKPTPAEIVQQVQSGDTWGGDYMSRTCRACGQSRLHQRSCGTYLAKLENSLNDLASQHEETKRIHAKYVKDNPSRARIKQLLERRAAHIVDLQAAMGRRNAELEDLRSQVVRLSDDRTVMLSRIRDLESGNQELLDRSRAAADRRREVERLEEMVRIQSEELATQHSWDVRESTDEALLEELLRRAIERDR